MQANSNGHLLPAKSRLQCSYGGEITAAFRKNFFKHEPGACVAMQPVSFSQQLVRVSAEGTSWAFLLFVSRSRDMSETPSEKIGSYLRERRTTKGKRYFNISSRSPLRLCLKNDTVSMAVAVDYN